VKKQIDIFEYAGDVCKAMAKGILLTTKGRQSKYYDHWLGDDRH